jgi:hypothetical protein
MCILLALAAVGAVSALIYNFKDSLSIKGTVSLYREVLGINRRISPDVTMADTLKLHAKAATTTASTVASWTSKAVFERVFGPKRKIGDLLVVSYYHSGAWREALVKSTSSATSVVRIDAECKPGAECKDPNTCGFIAGTLNVTDEVKQLLGPSEDCFGYTLCPNDLGYNSLVINFLKDGRASSIKIERTEDIGTALTGAKKVAESATTDF